MLFAALKNPRRSRDLKTSALILINNHFINISAPKHIFSCQKKQRISQLRKSKWIINLSLSSQVPSGIVGRPGTLKWLAWRFWAVLLDTIHTSFLLSGLLHSLERYSVMHLATSSFQWCNVLSLICEEVRQETSERPQTEIVSKIRCQQHVKWCFFHVIKLHDVRCQAVMSSCHTVQFWHEHYNEQSNVTISGI